MLPITFAATLVFLMTVCSPLSIGEAFTCKPIANGEIDCSSAQIIIDSKPFPKADGLDQRARLSSPQNQVQWRCGDVKGKLTWTKKANEIRVNFHDNGEVDWMVYKCDKKYFSAGPPSAGKECFVKSKEITCPLGNGSHCVYEYEKFSSSGKEINVEARVKGSKAIDVINKFTGAAGLKIRVVQKTEEREKIYLIVAAGTSFCVNIVAKSFKDADATRGYAWGCYAPDIDEKRANGKCTELTQCNDPSIICSGTSVYLALSAFLVTLAYTAYLSII